MIKKHVFTTLRQRACLLVLSLSCATLGLSACSPVAQLAGTTTAPAAPVAPSATPPVSASQPSSQASNALPVLQINDEASQITIIVRRGGLLARLGHDHVILVKHLVGSVDRQHNRASLEFRLDQMEVDPPALRLAAGLSTQPSAEAIAGTRHNMLTRTLDAERYPLVQIQAERNSTGDGLLLSLTLHGVTRQLQLPARITSDKQGLRAEGSFTILQSDYGITPFAVMGGALAVQDQLELHYRLQAH